MRACFFARTKGIIMAQTKKYKVTGKQNTRGSGKRKAPAKKEAVKERSVFSQFVPFILFIIAVLIIISFFVKNFGTVGNFIRDKFFFGMFSSSFYLLPVLLILIGVILLASDETPKARLIVYSIVGFLIIDTLCHLVFAKPEMMSEINPFVHFSECTVKDGKISTGGGLVGGFIGGLLSACFSRVGAFIISFAALAVLVMVIMKKTPKDAAHGVADSIGRHREARREARAEREAAREREIAEAARRTDGKRRRADAPYTAPDPDPSADGYYDDYDGFDEIEESGYGILDDSVFEGERKTEFDPTITDEDFPITPKDGTDVEEPAAEETFPREEDEATELEPVASGDGEGLTLEELDGLDDDEVLDRLSKTYLNPDKLKVEETDLAPTLDGGDVVDIPVAEPEYVFPDIDFLIEDKAKKNNNYRRELEEKEAKLIQTLEKFNVHTESAGLPQKGPTVTRYELRPAPGTRVRAIVNLVDDIALSLATSGIRIEAPIPGKSAVGIEVPNDEAMIVRLRSLIDSDRFRESESKLTVALGEDVAGTPIFFDISKMPHLLIAGATGMGKSVCINCLIVSMLYKAKPDEVQLILVDPKKVEFNIYEGLPHLIVPVVSDPKKAAGALSWAVNEMERRFGIIEEAKVRNIAGYNEIAKNDPDKKPLPHIVIIIDELADLMMTAPDSVESSIDRLAAKARAAGMHLILGTQRPSVDVITGKIKNNIPSRIACKVSSQIDSRTIIDTQGAEKLIGKGDMLFNPVGSMKPIRVQGAFVTDPEIDKIVNFIKENNTDKSGYNDEVMSEIETEAVRCTATKRELAAMADSENATAAANEDPMFWRAAEIAVENGKISTSLLQRKCSIGFGRASKLIDSMQDLGFVTAPDGQKPRRVLISRERLQEMKMAGSLVALAEELPDEPANDGDTSGDIDDITF